MEAERSEFCVCLPSSYDNQYYRVIVLQAWKPYNLKGMCKIPRLPINNRVLHTDLLRIKSILDRSKENEKILFLAASIPPHKIFSK